MKINLKEFAAKEERSNGGQFSAYKIMEQFLTQNSWVTIIAIIWSVPWKGLALWKAARLNDKWWFIALLVINTLAVLEILYIFIFSKRKTLLGGKSSPEV